ncbi:MAG TPA: HEAT repeat domain-containing protein [Nitrospira sp.]|nr:HEAT repeat domain-containing protein [Nitrospira sp.]
MFPILWWVVLCLTPPVFAASSTVGSNVSELERDAASAFQRAEYDRVLKDWQSLPAEATPSKSFLRLALQSQLKLGHAEEALALYDRLVPREQQEDRALLRALALGMITSHVRDPQEHIRIAAYSVLADLGIPETESILEDGLLDSSPVVRGRALEGLGHAGLGAKSGAARRALLDDMAAVRIAAINVLSEAKVADIVPRLIEVARTEDGPEGVFAYAGLYRLGKDDMLADITGAATLPDPETRMAALGVLGQLKRPSTLAVLAQGVYDPEPSVRAFAAGALGAFGQPGAAAPLTHALGDEHARVRGAAAASLGRLGIKDNRPLLQALTRDASMQVRAQAVEGLLRLGDSTALLLAADLARHPDPSVRAAAAQALSASPDKEAVAILQTLLQDQQPQPRLFAAKALGKTPQSVLPLLKKALHDSDTAVRVTAAGSLLQHLDRSAKPASRGRKG